MVLIQKTVCSFFHVNWNDAIRRQEYVCPDQKNAIIVGAEQVIPSVVSLEFLAPTFQPTRKVKGMMLLFRLRTDLAGLFGDKKRCKMIIDVRCMIVV